MSGGVVFDKRKDMVLRKCWWMSTCCTRMVKRMYPIIVDHKVVDWGEREMAVGFVAGVTEEEAENGKGRACPWCGRTSGCYVCDGFPTFQGSTVFKEG